MLVQYSWRSSNLRHTYSCWWHYSLRYPLTPLIVIAVLVPRSLGISWGVGGTHSGVGCRFWDLPGLAVRRHVATNTYYVFLRVIFVSTSLINAFILSGVTIILSLVPLLYPRTEVCRVLGIVMVFLGILMWLLAAGGLTWGSILAIISGAYLFDWRPRH